MTDYLAVSNDVKLGKNVKLSRFINLYGCSIGDNTKIGAFVEIQKHAIIGKNCKISSHTFVCEGVTIGDNCFIGHGVVFINDNYPRAVNAEGRVEEESDWADRFLKTSIEDNVAIGSNATILGNVSVGYGSIIAAGSVLTRSIPAKQVWAGNPAQFLKRL